MIPNPQQPIISGQCADVLEIILKRGSVLSLELPTKYAIPQYNARISDLRSKGFHIISNIQPVVEYMGNTHKNVAIFSLGNPIWPSPEHLAKADQSKGENQ